jgi:predicted RNase H-like HicB family nuclease
LRYYAVYERSDTGWSAYPPDLPGVGVTGVTREEVREIVRGAIAMHIDGLREDGLPIPEPSREFVDVA